MTMKETWVGLLCTALATGGFATVSGCDMLKKKKDESTAETVTSEPEPTAEPEPATAEATTETTAEAATDAGTAEEDAGTVAGDDEVKTYPNQIPASGTYVLLKSFNVYQAADIESKKLGGVGRGTIINLKATLGEWMLVEWPAGPGEMKPGWIKVRTSESNFIQKSETVKDAGAPPPVVDAGAPPKQPRRVPKGMSTMKKR